MPIYFSMVLILTKPLDLIAKKNIISHAKSLIADKKDLIIIGVAGSYGKTTLKNVLIKVLEQKYKVISPDGNINTAVGISDWILKEGLSNAEILIIEFGEEYKGDNKRIAEIFSQNFLFITGINEAHFERLGSLENIGSTIFEAATNLKPAAKIFLNKDDKNIVKDYKKYISNQNIEFYEDQNNIKNRKFDPNTLLWEAETNNLGKISVPILGEYIFSDISAVIKIAKILKLTDQQIKAGLSKLKPVQYRLEPLKKEGNIIAINDGYNANPEGIKQAIRVLSLFKDRRKIYITPGMVETGEKKQEIHKNIGKDLTKVADLVILIKNSVTPYIEKGLIENGFDKKNILWFDYAQKAHESLKNILKPGDVILFQNDWGDQYI